MVDVNYQDCKILYQDYNFLSQNLVDYIAVCFQYKLEFPYYNLLEVGY